MNNEKIINLENLTYYDSKIKDWVLEKLKNNNSSSAIEIKENFNMWELEDGDYYTNTPIHCAFDDKNGSNFGNIYTKLSTYTKDIYKYYIINDFYNMNSNSEACYDIIFGKVNKNTGEDDIGPNYFEFEHMIRTLTDLINDSQLEII